MYQVVTVYAGQRLVSERFTTKGQARVHAEVIYFDAPVEVVEEKTGRLVGWTDERGWHRQPSRACRPVEEV